MANHILMRLPTSANPGFVYPLEALTNETPDLSDLIVPISPSYVTQVVTGSLSTHAREGFFCGYPEYITPGVWEHYFPDTPSLCKPAAMLYPVSG
jgi:hypothetical protein